MSFVVALNEWDRTVPTLDGSNSQLRYSKVTRTDLSTLSIERISQRVCVVYSIMSPMVIPVAGTLSMHESYYWVHMHRKRQNGRFGSTASHGSVTPDDTDEAAELLLAFVKLVVPYRRLLPISSISNSIEVRFSPSFVS